MADKNTIEMIKKLVAFDTTSRESNLDLIDFIKTYLANLGIKSSIISDETGKKANLYATIGDFNTPGIMLSGHTDVVPVDGQKWNSDPFKCVKIGNKIFGRGTSDMKGFIGIVLSQLPKFKQAHLKTPIHLAFSYDEEIGCIGVRKLIENINSLPVKPKMCIVGEPTSMEVMIGHKGKRSYDVCVNGLESHSSLTPHGVNAIEYAAETISYLKNIADHIATKGKRDDLYDVPYTTVHTGTISGGTALNIVPKKCQFQFEFRYIDQDDPEKLEEKIKKYVKQNIVSKMHKTNSKTDIVIQCVNEIPSLNLNADEEIVTFVKSLAGKNNHGKVAFGTEAGLFQKRANIPTLICGPGDIQQAHKPNEYIEIKQIEECENFLIRLLERISEN